ncbi:MAG TPA: hypothetical protein VHL11_03330 [Phototrophicaceae bacterium]|nr:hypothetical protein [Phototrophicaceae bacterium]
MTGKQKTGMKPSTRMAINPALSQTVESDLSELLDSIEHLRVGCCS